jgi:hypothetical protein
MVFSLQQLAARGVGARQIGENQGGQERTDGASIA